MLPPYPPSCFDGLVEKKPETLAVKPSSPSTVVRGLVFRRPSPAFQPLPRRIASRFPKPTAGKLDMACLI